MTRQEMLDIYSDFHKDAYGFRPRFNYMDFSDEKLKSDFERFELICDDIAREEANELERSLKAWDSLIQRTIDMGAGDYKTALRWIVMAEDENDPEYIVWKFGILYSEKGRKLADEIGEVMCELLGG